MGEYFHFFSFNLDSVYSSDDQQHRVRVWQTFLVGHVIYLLCDMVDPRGRAVAKIWSLGIPDSIRSQA